VEESAKWRATENDRRAKYYPLTERARKAERSVIAMMRNVIDGIRALVHRNQRNVEIQEELRSFQDASVDEKMQRGMSREAALRVSRAEVDSAESVRHKVWAAGWESAVDSLWHDLHYAVRMLVKSPGFTSVAVLTLALGIGANAAVFSLVNAVLLRPLPYANPNQLVDLSTAKAGVSGAGVSYPAFFELRDHSRAFTSAAGFAGHALTLTGHGDPADVSTVAVTPEYFSLLGTMPLLGRALSPEDGKRGAPPVVVLSEQLWRSRFGADLQIEGTSITLDQRAFSELFEQ
jgi:hypothetical protein